MEIYFYTKEGCSLCKKAEEALESLISKYNLTVYRIDIGNDQKAHQKYWDMIPVIELPHGNILWGRLDRDDIDSALRKFSLAS